MFYYPLYNNAMSTTGTLSQHILHTVAAGPNHGYAIAQIIKSRAKGLLDNREAMLYPALHALEGRGDLESYEKSYNGRVKRFYKITEKGLRSLTKERTPWTSVSTASNPVVEAAR